ncbi:hypothetical protein [Eisenibacter elegans]|uniref:DUF7832 domain-containing protein n=1 Tax=Eisenibacter elegans TaxID=997 RepID=UPI001B7FE09C|nr:hypothetical protein [Eisenibacter elegans]
MSTRFIPSYQQKPLVFENISTEPLVYDRADWHFLGQFPTDLPIEQAHVHIGLFMGWLIDQELTGVDWEDELHWLARFKRREVSCALLSALWDGTLHEGLLNDTANAFAAYYYQNGLYYQDYLDILCQELPSMYHTADTWENYERLRQRLNERYAAWSEGLFLQIAQLLLATNSLKPSPTTLVTGFALPSDASLRLPVPYRPQTPSFEKLSFAPPEQNRHLAE